MLVICYSISQTSLSLTVSWKVEKNMMIVLPNRYIRYILQGRTQRSSVSFSRTFGAPSPSNTPHKRNPLINKSSLSRTGYALVTLGVCWNCLFQNELDDGKLCKKILYLYSVFKSMISCFPLPIDWFLDFPLSTTGVSTVPLTVEQSPMLVG